MSGFQAAERYGGRGKRVGLIGEERTFPKSPNGVVFALGLKSERRCEEERSTPSLPAEARDVFLVLRSDSARSILRGFKRMRITMIDSNGGRRSAHLLAAIFFLSGTLSLTATTTGATAAAQRDKRLGAAEVFVVADVSAESRCEVVYTDYADAEYQIPIAVSAPVPCQGGVIHTSVVSADEARIMDSGEAPGQEVRVVAPTGNATQDEAQVRQVQRELIAENAAAASANAGSDQSQAFASSSSPIMNSPGLVGAAACNTIQRGASMSYLVNGGAYRVSTYAYYSRNTSCSWKVTSTQSQIMTPGGRGVFWRYVDYNNPTWEVGMGCTGLHDDRTVAKSVNKGINLNGLFVSETSDRNFCTGLANSYTGSVYLT